MKQLLFFTLMVISLKLYSQNINTIRIDSLISSIEKNNQDLGSISIFKDGKEFYKRTFGETNLNSTKQIPNLKYHIGSVSKMITATLIFKLIDEKKISLDEKLYDYYPEIPNAKNISIQNLLSHKSGLGNYIVKDSNNFWLQKPSTEKEILDEIIKQGIAFQPNQSVLYSNSAYYLLVKILEKKLQSSYGKLLEKRVIKPLKLQNFASFQNTNYNNIALSYIYDNYWKQTNDFYFRNVIGVGDIASTMYDTNMFITKLFSSKIISKSSLQKMIPEKANFFGNGLINSSFGGNILYGHHGDTYGSHSIVLYDPTNKIAISLVLNGEKLSKDDVVYYLLNIIYKNKRSLSERQITNIEVGEIQGLYKSTELPLQIKISIENNFLKADVLEQSSFPLDRISKNEFEYFAAGIKLEFNAPEKVMLLKQRGQTYKFIKE